MIRFASHRTARLFALPLLALILSVGSTSTGAATNLPLQVGINTLAGSIDSLAVFATELERTIARLVSLNPELTSDDQADILTAGYLDSGDGESGDDTSVFTMGDRGTGASTILNNIFASDEERIEHGLMIRSLPISAPVEGVVTSGFGMRNHPILRGRRAHKGLDIAAPTGTEIFAPGAGVVTFSGRKGGYGNTIIVDHGYGYSTLYAHCSRLLVDEGATLSRGDVIALVGSTGRSTGPHLHYEVRINGSHMNPTAFIFYERDQDNLLKMISDWYITV